VVAIDVPHAVVSAVFTKDVEGFGEFHGERRQGLGVSWWAGISLHLRSLPDKPAPFSARGLQVASRCGSCLRLEPSSAYTSNDPVKPRLCVLQGPHTH
jgi:hypothetical protein